MLDSHSFMNENDRSFVLILLFELQNFINTDISISIDFIRVHLLNGNKTHGQLILKMNFCKMFYVGDNYIFIGSQLRKLMTLKDLSNNLFEVVILNV